MTPGPELDGDSSAKKAKAKIEQLSREQDRLRQALEAERARAGNLEVALVETRKDKASLERRLGDLERRAETRALLQGFAEAAPGALWVAEACTKQGRYVSSGLEALLGTPPEAILPEAGRWLGLVHADDRAAVVARFETLLRGEAAEIEYRVLPQNGGGDGSGQSRWVRDLGFPIHAEGQVRYVAGFVVDAAERGGAEGMRRLLLAELNHRVRNTLATVHTLAVQTIKAAPSADAFWSAFTGRLHALTRAHDRLSEGGWASGAELQTLLEAELAPYLGTADSGAGPSAMLNGPPVRLESGAAVVLALALHEMATNAVRHGALSVPTGHVEVRWQFNPLSPRSGGAAESGWLQIDWLERAGPPLPGPPPRRGFGARLLERNLPRQLGGEVVLRFDPAGLQVGITVPLRMAAEPAGTPCPAQPTSR